MTPALFDNLLSFVLEDLKREHAVREPLEPGERLAITLSYLASGQDIKDVALAYRVGFETARQCIHFCCQVIWKRLKGQFMKVPSQSDWVEVAQGFGYQWQFPNCLGAVDGSHVFITAPANSGSLYFNYKEGRGERLRHNGSPVASAPTHYKSPPKKRGLRHQGGLCTS
ncbi:hypothetical protein MTO96_020863 [Rhipicephalus appendiculatus]